MRNAQRFIVLIGWFGEFDVAMYYHLTFNESKTKYTRTTYSKTDTHRVLRQFQLDELKNSNQREIDKSQDVSINLINTDG